MRKARSIYQYLAYRLKAKGRHGIHSPFVYSFIGDVLRNTAPQPELQQLEQLANDLRNSRTMIEVTDFGAFTRNKKFTTRFRRVGDIARLSGTPPKIGRLLFNMLRYYKPEYILELGTSFGISTLYMALANANAKISTIEGCANTAEIAQKNFSRMKLHNIKMHVGEFGGLLSKVTEKIPRLDFVFIDGNHRKEPTIKYFEACLEKKHNDTIMVFDDIYWSKGMHQAWDQIKSHPEVTVSIDLYRLGIIFFRKELSKQDFVLR